MLVVDAQVHVWAAETPERPWISETKHLVHASEPLTPARLLGQMDRAGVDRALLVPPTWEGEGERNDVALEAAEQHPERFGVIVRFRLDDPAYEHKLARWARLTGVFGTRIVSIRQTAEWLRNGTADWFWPVASRLGLPVMVFAPYQYDVVAQVARRYPDVRLAICHLGLHTRLRDAEIFPEVEKLLPLARYPNVAVKATSLPSFVTEPYPFPSLHEPIRRVVEAFGPRRVFWGSDLSRLSCSYTELRRFFTEKLDFLSGEDLELVMGRAVSKWFGWDLPGERVTEPTGTEPLGATGAGTTGTTAPR